MTITSTLRRKLADRQVHVVTFTKRDGTLRTMRLVYEGGSIRGTMMQVRDLDLNEIRTVNLATIHTHWSIKPKTTAAPAPATFDPSAMTCEEIAALF